MRHNGDDEPSRPHRGAEGDFPGKVSAYCHDPKDVRIFYEDKKTPLKKQTV